MLLQLLRGKVRLAPLTRYGGPNRRHLLIGGIGIAMVNTGAVMSKSHAIGRKAKMILMTWFELSFSHFTDMFFSGDSEVFFHLMDFYLMYYYTMDYQEIF